MRRQKLISGALVAMEKRAEDEKDVNDMTLNCIARGSYPQDATKQVNA